MFNICVYLRSSVDLSFYLPVLSLTCFSSMQVLFIYFRIVTLTKQVTEFKGFLFYGP